MALQSNLIWTVRQLAVLLEQYGKARMEALDLSPTQGIVLQYLLGHRNRKVYGVELHETLGLSKSSVSATLKALRQKGYLRIAEKNHKLLVYPLKDPDDLEKPFDHGHGTGVNAGKLLYRQMDRFPFVPDVFAAERGPRTADGVDRGNDR